MGYIPFTNHLLTSWDIQVVGILTYYTSVAANIDMESVYHFGWYFSAGEDEDFPWLYV